MLATQDILPTDQLQSSLKDFSYSTHSHYLRTHGQSFQEMFSIYIWLYLSYSKVYRPHQFSTLYVSRQHIFISKSLGMLGAYLAQFVIPKE